MGLLVYELGDASVCPLVQQSTIKLACNKGLDALTAPSI